MYVQIVKLRWMCQGVYLCTTVTQAADNLDSTKDEVKEVVA